jgi:DNA modification methylase
MINQIINKDWKEVAKELPDKSVNLIVDDPPYNVPPFVTGPMSEYLSEMAHCLRESNRVCSGTTYFFAYPEVACLLLPIACKNCPGAGAISGNGVFENGRLLIWHYKNKNAMHHRVIWSRSFECILMLWNGKDKDLVFNADDVRTPYIYRFKQGSKRKGTPGRFGERDTTRNYHDNGAWPRDVIECPALVGGKGKQEGLGHPSQKPEWLIEQLIKASSKEGDIVLDWHSGSGTTAAVARNLKRNYISCEIDKNFYDISVKRLCENAA